jgi:TPR repeat protein
LNESARYSRLSADQGHAAAQCDYGVCLQTCQNVSTNLNESAR